MSGDHLFFKTACWERLLAGTIGDLLRTYAKTGLTLLILCFTAWTSLFAQGSSGTLRGQVTDETGAIIPGANITAAGPSDLTKTAMAGNDGVYVLSDLPP